MNINEVVLSRRENLSQRLTDKRRAMRLCERPTDPVVNDLRDGQALVKSPADLPACSSVVEFGPEHGRVMPVL